MKKLFIYFLLICFTHCISKCVEALENYSYRDMNSKNDVSLKNSDKDAEVLFIVDFSGSMNEKMGYTPKAYLAIDAIRSILEEANQETSIGLRIFGVSDKELVRRTSDGLVFNKQNICTASQLLLPIAKYNAENVSDKLSRINPNGGTPIGYSLRQAVNSDFSHGNNLKHIILVTDGGENCGDDPCIFITNLMRTRSDIKIDVIAITVDSNAYSQLNCLALKTNGKYYSVNNPEDFKISFKQAFNSVSHVKPSVSNIKMETKKQEEKPAVNYNIKYKTYGFEFNY